MSSKNRFIQFAPHHLIGPSFKFSLTSNYKPIPSFPHPRTIDSPSPHPTHTTLFLLILPPLDSLYFDFLLRSPLSRFFPFNEYKPSLPLSTFLSDWKARRSQDFPPLSLSHPRAKRHDDKGPPRYNGDAAAADLALSPAANDVHSYPSASVAPRSVSGSAGMSGRESRSLE